MNVTVKLKDPLVKSARHRAVDQGLSLSAWLARLIEKELGQQGPSPSESFLDRIGDERLAEVELEVKPVKDPVREIEW